MVAPPVGEPLDMPGSDADLAISPDGSRIVFTAGNPPQIYVRALDQLEPQLLPGLGTPRAPFFSADGQWVGFFDGLTLKKVTVNGGPALTVSNVGSAVPQGASWGADNTIIVATQNAATGLLRVPAGGGEPEVLTKPNVQKGEVDHLWPEILPGGQAVLFTIVTGTTGFGRIANAQVALLDLRTMTQRVLVPGGSFPRYVSTGHIVYGVAGTLRAVAFDLGTLEVRSDPVPVLQHVVTKANGAACFSVAENGSLVYVAGDVQQAGRALVWVDRRGREEPLSAPPREYVYPTISPDGTKVALDVRDQENDIWIWDFARETLARLTFDPGLDRRPIWTPDGRRIAFSSQQGGNPGNVFWRAADGAGAVERLTEDPNQQIPGSFSPDGARLIFYGINTKTGNDIEMVSLGKEHRVTPLAQTTFTERNPDVSPDGRWLAFESDESGRLEVHVRPFPDVDEGRWQVSTSGGTRPRWAPGGRELFYFVEPGRMMVVPVQSGATFAAGNPQLVFEGRYVASQPGRTYDVSADGQRFLMIKERGAVGQTSTAREIVVVQNWTEELKRLVPNK
jgi:serine/threonine-protein kinase